MYERQLRLVEEEEEFNLVFGFFLEKVILVVSDMGDNIMSLSLVVSLLVMFSCLDVLLLLLLLLLFALLLVVVLGVLPPFCS